MSRLFHLWVYLETTPLLGLTITLAVFLFATVVARRGATLLPAFPTLANPVLIAIILLVLFLEASGLSYAAYFQGAQYIHFLLGPATVALAVPLYDHLGEIRKALRALFPALLLGSATAAASAVVVAEALGAPRVVVLSLLPKSVTTPIAMGIADAVGGDPSLAAVFVLITGLTASLIALPLLRALGVRDFRALGFAAGVSGHGLATAEMFRHSAVAGAFGGLAIGLNGLATSLIVPLIARLFVPH